MKIATATSKVLAINLPVFNVLVSNQMSTVIGLVLFVMFVLVVSWVPNVFKNPSPSQLSLPSLVLLLLVPSQITGLLLMTEQNSTTRVVPTPAPTSST